MTYPLCQLPVSGHRPIHLSQGNILLSEWPDTANTGKVHPSGKQINDFITLSINEG